MKIAATLLLCLTTWVGFAQRDTVHVVFKTHLDVGFTDYASEIVKLYVEKYIPDAIKTAREMEAMGNDRFVWTTGSWIIRKYFEMSSDEKVKLLEEAIRDGIIVWNAYPHTFGSELTDAPLFDFALSLAGELDKKYGRKTISAKITDVPGETIGAIRLLDKAGVKLVHIGVNGASTRPDTPPVFLWRDADGKEVIILYHNGYAGTFSVPGLNHKLHFAFTGDNLGPQTAFQVQKVFAELRQKYPGAVVMASTMDAFTEQIWKVKDTLPLITSEIGSSWIHSAGTDPKKYATFRALMRLRTSWLEKKLVDPANESFRRFSDLLLIAIEHTGGLDEKLNIDFEHYSPSELAPKLETFNYQRMMKSWDDARDYLRQAIDALGDSPLAAQARKEIALLDPQVPSTQQYTQVSLQQPLKSEHFTIRIDSKTGAISSLVNNKNKAALVDSKYPMGLFWHESFSSEDYKRFFSQYIRTDQMWAVLDFGKPNAEKSGAVSQKRMPQVKQAWQKRDAKSLSVLLHLTVPETQPTEYGLPEAVWVQIDFPGESPEVNYTVQWFNKKANRLPEAYWFSMGFNGLNPEKWKIEKTGYMVSPTDIVPKGGRSLHGFDRGVFYNDGKRKVEVLSLDCPVVAPGSTLLLDFNDELPDLNKGWHFNLFNNKWGTNFPTWYSDDAKFRFTISFDNQ